MSSSQGSPSNSDLCCFCLGDDTEIPAFGSIADARDMVKPCTTCSISCHKKCLLDWFNTIPSNQLHVIHAKRVFSAAPLSRENYDHIGGDIGIGSPPVVQSTNIHINLSTRALNDWFGNIIGIINEDEEDGETQEQANNGSNGFENINENRDADPHTDPGMQTYQPDGERDTDISRTRLDAVSLLPSTSSTSSSSSSHSPHLPTSSPQHVDDLSVYVLAKCPQCKKDIIFFMKRSKLVALQASFKTGVSRLVQYGGVFLGITSALTGVVSMTYIGLTTAGLKMMDSLVPGPLLVRMLTRRSLLSSNNTYSTLSRILFGNTQTYAVDNLEQALVQGLIDPLKFSRIPVLPIVLFRLRSSSIFDVLFAAKNDDFFASAITELMIASYISSLADNSLVRAIYKNIVTQIKQLMNGSMTSILNPVRGIDFLTTNNIISLLIPIRWGYDLFHRLTFNRAYFNLTMKSRPRAIANSLGASEVERLEELNGELNEYRSHHNKTYQAIDKQVSDESTSKIASCNIPVISALYKHIKKNIRYIYELRKSWWPYYRLCVKTNLQFTLASLKHDYSFSLSSPSVIFKTITTILWPLASSKVGLLVLPLLSRVSKLEHLSLDRKVLIANIAGLVIVALGKEIINLYIAHRRVQQMQQIEPLNLNKAEAIVRLVKSSGVMYSSDAEDLDDGIINIGGAGETDEELLGRLTQDIPTELPGNFPS
ncbi:hypothetical protein LELG_03027 [Lodderomyces elongisporus NRRL YB-4239]|uniref:Uncharacterized protein n=1 Tax=Lodderomyces elongisporus (strain ATCC 11503 / CBS 2605 / JCM 1781 / NBRC 1676 / NRRL YB-4239) TaxID=379508 RepID=A5E090_LODEL|nr:hypothetical protein LELG_03027 [Lodderomyces elongisporus NRRL YB-4239]